MSRLYSTDEWVALKKLRAERRIRAKYAKARSRPTLRQKLLW